MDKQRPHYNNKWIIRLQWPGRTYLKIPLCWISEHLNFKLEFLLKTKTPNLQYKVGNVTITINMTLCTVMSYETITTYIFIKCKSISCICYMHYHEIRFNSQKFPLLINKNFSIFHIRPIPGMSKTI